MNIGWICLSGVGKSETFLSDTLSELRSFANVRAVSGVSEGSFEGTRGHHYIPFAEHKLTLWHTLRKRITGRNVHRQEVQKRCLKMVSPVFAAFEPDIFWVEFGTTAVAARRMLEEAKRPFFIAVHGYDITSEFKDSQYRDELVSMMNATQCAGVICASHYTRRLCVLAGVGEDKTHVIRLGLDGEKIKPFGLPKTHEPSFVHFGRLVEKKHPIATLEAFRRVQRELPNARMTFIGEGPLFADLQMRVRSHGLDDHVNLLGALQRDEALEMVEKHWVFVQHSVTAKSGDQEGYALSPAEAALLELPVVSTLHNGIPEHVRHGETGYLVPEFDYTQMADRMLYLASDEGLRQQFGRAGRINVLEVNDPIGRVQRLRKLIFDIKRMGD